MNRLFVVNKPLFVGSNGYLGYIKRKYGFKKAGFSGTLDPFAKGCLLVASGEYTKLFSYLKTEPKEYIATLWLGAKSETLDIEGVEHIETMNAFCLDEIKAVLHSLIGEVEYRPPSFSAKRVNGVRAYKLARSGEAVEMKAIKSKVYEIELLNYCHPFLSFRCVVSKGSYVRSLGAMIADRLGCEGSLSYLERTREGAFFFDAERSLNPVEYLDLPKNRYNNDHEDLLLGRKLKSGDFECRSPGRYYVENGSFLTIVGIEDENVKYLANRISLC